MTYTYTPSGVCSRQIELDIENDILTAVRFRGGCPGNLQGISSLVAGMPVDEVIRRLEGIRCGFKSTSCPDQLSKALQAVKAQQNG